MNNLTEFDIAVENLDPEKAQTFIIQTLQLHSKVLTNIQGSLQKMDHVTIINGGGKNRPKLIPRDQFFQELYDKISSKSKASRLNQVYKILKPIVIGLGIMGMIAYYIFTYGYIKGDEVRQQQLKQDIIHSITGR